VSCDYFGEYSFWLLTRGKTEAVKFKFVFRALARKVVGKIVTFFLIGGLNQQTH
jgi:hypothetical protein